MICSDVCAFIAILTMCVFLLYVSMDSIMTHNISGGGGGVHG